MFGNNENFIRITSVFFPETICNDSRHILHFSNNLTATEFRLKAHKEYNIKTTNDVDLYKVMW